MIEEKDIQRNIGKGDIDYRFLYRETEDKAKCMECGEGEIVMCNHVCPSCWACTKCSNCGCNNNKVLDEIDRFRKDGCDLLGDNHTKMSINDILHIK